MTEQTHSKRPRNCTVQGSTGLRHCSTHAHTHLLTYARGDRRRARECTAKTRLLSTHPRTHTRKRRQKAKGKRVHKKSKAPHRPRTHAHTRVAAVGWLTTAGVASHCVPMNDCLGVLVISPARAREGVEELVVTIRTPSPPPPPFNAPSPPPLHPQPPQRTQLILFSLPLASMPQGLRH